MCPYQYKSMIMHLRLNGIQNYSFMLIDNSLFDSVFHTKAPLTILQPKIVSYSGGKNMDNIF